MPKQSIMDAIVTELNKMNITYQTGGNTDITVIAEFLDAHWSTGNKKIVYEASIFVDESVETVFMWELTTEKGSGISFGSDNESAFQSGATLFRKVKSIQYGPEGKVYEYTFDIGAISKAVIAVAKQNGWKFKTVLRKEKASYPAGYVGTYISSNQSQPMTTYSSYCTNCGSGLPSRALFCQQCGLPSKSAASQPYTSNRPQDAVQAAGYSAAQPVTNEKQSKSGKVAGLLLGISCGLILVFFALMGIPWIGWVLSIVVMASFFLMARKVAARSIPLMVVLWLISMVAVFIIFIFSI